MSLVLSLLLLDNFLHSFYTLPRTFLLFISADLFYDCCSISSSCSDDWTTGQHNRSNKDLKEKLARIQLIISPFLVISLLSFRFSCSFPRSSCCCLLLHFLLSSPRLILVRTTLTHEADGVTLIPFRSYFSKQNSSIIEEKCPTHM